MGVSTSRTVKLELPNGRTPRITLRTARMLSRRGHVTFISHSPMIVRLRLWALPFYRRFYSWGVTSSDEGSPTNCMLMGRTPRRTKSPSNERDLPETWGVKHESEQENRCA